MARHPLAKGRRFMSVGRHYRADPRHPTLSDDFYDVVDAAGFPRSDLRFRNQRWAERVGLGDLDDDEWLDHFAAFSPLPHNIPEPLALRYHGHQFRSYNPDLGDGRGFLFAQLRDVEDGRLLDLATKGSGTTPWSRGGDGRLTLKGGVREVLATEMLEALGVYTSKSFSLIETGEALQRSDEPSPTRSSVLVRLGHSHVRFGSFQRQAYLRRSDNVEKLVTYSIATYFPDLANEPEPIAAFLARVVQLSADLAASWMIAGFVHGVLNTDNLNITGESFDYGPFRFLPTLEPGFTAAYFDRTGLYAYGRQPATVAWNLERLAETLLDLCPREQLTEALDTYQPQMNARYCWRMLERLGLVARDPKTRAWQARNAVRSDPEDPIPEDAVALTKGVTQFMSESQIGFEQFFFDWYAGAASAERARRSPEAEKYEANGFGTLRSAFDRFEATRPEALGDPYFQGEQPCTLLIDEIEALWSPIAEDDDWSAFETKLREIGGAARAMLVY
jgi:uncharacterized protein YdiU (UPF0061 family)